jgi:hypothetical protein
MDVQLTVSIETLVYKKECGPETNLHRTLEFGGDCWIFYGLDSYNINKSNKLYGL